MKRNTLFPIFTDLGKVYSCLPSFNFSDKNIHIDTRIGYLWKNTKKKKSTVAASTKGKTEDSELRVKGRLFFTTVPYSILCEFTKSIQHYFLRNE